MKDKKKNFKAQFFIIALISLLVILLFLQTKENKHYEKYFSQQLRSDYVNFISMILYSDQLTNKLLTSELQEEEKESLSSTFYSISMKSQDINHFAHNIGRIKAKESINATSGIAMDIAGYLEKLDVKNVTKEDKHKLELISDLLNEWISVITLEYPEINYENQQEVMSIVNHENYNNFFKQSLWINIIVGLDEKSTEFQLLF